MMVLSSPNLLWRSPITPLIPSNEAPQDAENPSTQDAQDLPSRDDENPQDAHAALV